MPSNDRPPPSVRRAARSTSLEEPRASRSRRGAAPVGRPRRPGHDLTTRPRDLPQLLLACSANAVRTSLLREAGRAGRARSRVGSRCGPRWAATCTCSRAGAPRRQPPMAPRSFADSAGSPGVGSMALHSHRSRCAGGSAAQPQRLPSPRGPGRARGCRRRSRPRHGRPGAHAVVQLADDRPVRREHHNLEAAVHGHQVAARHCGTSASWSR
jgi:hypothetical protein